MKTNDIKAAWRSIGIMLAAEGGLMALCMVPALHFADGTASAIGICAAFTFAVGLLLWVSFGRYRRVDDRRMAYLMVVLVWLMLTLFGTLPFLATGATTSPTRAVFESMSGLTSTGATVFDCVAALPASVLLWRSMMQWFGGFGIVLMVLARFLICLSEEVIHGCLLICSLLIHPLVGIISSMISYLIGMK